MINNFISRIILNNFRNYNNKIIDFFEDFNVIVAPNGYGKTNILESISLFNDLKGLRKATIDELKNINNLDNELLFSVCLKFNNNDKLVLLQKEDKKNILFNDENIKKSSFINNLLKITWLTPQMDGFFIDSSSERRKFIDKTAELLFVDHYDNVKKYEFFVKERLKILLNQENNNKWLDIVEKKIVSLGVSIANVRNEIVKYLNDIFINNTTFFPTGIITLDGIVENMLDKDNSINVETFYLNKLKENRKIDIETKRTNFGIHKTDIIIFNKYKNIKASLCSTGEQKMLLLSLIIVRAIFSKNINKGLPILLLDEVYSHIDNNTKNNLFIELKKLNIQTFITGINKEDFIDLTNNFIEL